MKLCAKNYLVLVLDTISNHCISCTPLHSSWFNIWIQHHFTIFHTTRILLELITRKYRTLLFTHNTHTQTHKTKENKTKAKKRKKKNANKLKQCKCISYACDIMSPFSYVDFLQCFFFLFCLFISCITVKSAKMNYLKFGIFLCIWINATAFELHILNKSLNIGYSLQLNT